MEYHSNTTADHSRCSPGGPYRSTPLAGALRPVNRSGLRLGRMTVSCSVCLAYSSPAIESHVTPGELPSRDRDRDRDKQKNRDSKKKKKTQQRARVGEVLLWYIHIRAAARAGENNNVERDKKNKI